MGNEADTTVGHQTQLNGCLTLAFPLFAKERKVVRRGKEGGRGGSVETVDTGGRQRERERGGGGYALFVGWLVVWFLNVPASGYSVISGTDLHRQFYVLPH